MRPAFKNRIALFNTLAAAGVTLIVFIVVYGVVFLTSYHHLDQDIRDEKEEVFNNLLFRGDSILINRMPEWDEKEHQQVEVNPTFLQIVNTHGRLIFRSANLQSDYFLFDSALEQAEFRNSRINGKRIRLGQFPIRNTDGRIIGQLSIAVSQEESAIVLNNLLIALLIAFPVLLLVLYLATSLAAAKGIAPVHRLIRTASSIDDKNIHLRLPLPPHRDEIYQLAATINELLQRIENGLIREKQFTADASHELRTPLSAIRGTLEVLLRRQREPAYYEQKIGQVIREVDRMHYLLDQLLQLARLEAGSISITREPVDLLPFFSNLAEAWNLRLAEKQMQLYFQIPPDTSVVTDSSLLKIIVDNLIGNALKYGRTGGQIHCFWDPDAASLTIADDGPGIPAAHLPYLFDRFYRTDDSRNSRIQGAGLGLAIVKKLTNLLNLTIQADSQEGEGTRFTIYFPF